MEKLISKKEQAIVSEILNLNEIKLDILHHIYENAKSVNWEIDTKDDLRNKYPLGKHLGYIHFLDIDSRDYLAEINKYIMSVYESKNFTIEGLVNWILIIDRTGDLVDEEQAELISELLNILESSKIEDLINKLIDSYNDHYIFEIENQNPKDLNEWTRLINSASFFYPFDAPIDTLVKILYSLKSKINIFDILLKLKPAPRASVIFHRVYMFIDQSENDILKLLGNPKSDIIFIVFMLLHDNNKNKWVGESLIKELVRNRWEEGGKWLFRVSFSPYQKYNADTMDICKKVICSYFIDQFTTKELQETIIRNFEWPVDFESLGGWLKEYDNNIKFNIAFENDITSKLTVVFNNIRANLPKYTFERTLEYDDWFKDILDQRSQYMAIYILKALLNSSDSEWEKLCKAFKSLCYELKTLYYGSYGAIIIAKKITNRLIILVTSLQFDNIDEKRLRILINTLVEIVAFPWIRFTEREEAIWNNIEYTPNYIIDSELILVIKKLKILYSSDKRELLDSIYKSIEKYSTIKWPIYA